MQKLGASPIHADILLCILCALPTFEALFATVRASRAFHATYVQHGKRVLNSVAFNYVGPALPLALQVARYDSHLSPEGFNTGLSDNDHSTGLQVEIKDVYPLVNNEKVVAEWENLFSFRKKDMRHETSQLTSLESWQFRKAMHRLMLYTRLFPTDEKRTPHTTGVSVGLWVDNVDSSDMIASNRDFTDIALSVGPAVILECYKTLGFEPLTETINKLCTDTTPDYFEDKSSRPLLAGYLFKSVSAVLENRDANDHRYVSLKIIDIDTLREESCSQCGAESYIGGLWGKTTWDYLSLSSQTLGTYLFPSLSMFMKGELHRNPVEIKHVEALLVKTPFKEIHEDIYSKNLKLPAWHDRNDDYWICQACLTQFVKDHLHLWVIMKRKEAKERIANDCWYGYNCRTQVHKSNHAQQLNHLSTFFDYGFHYSTKLRAHSSCINALALSSNGGRFLASGGDDLDVHLWDFHQEDINKPCHTLVGPRNNIFCLEFSRSNQFLFAGGTDTIVHQYDVSRLEIGPLSKLPMNMVREHDTIRDVTCSPFRDEVFFSGSENGRIIQHDARLSFSPNIRTADIIQLTAEVTSVQFHPTVENLFITSDSNSNEQRRPEPSSVAFDREGKKLAITSLHYYPTIYSLSDTYPIAICTGNSVARSPSQRTYSNSCTMKHGCFGGPGPMISDDDYYLGGSDDFCGYLWKIPPVEQLMAQREEIPAHEWRLDGSNIVGFTENADSSKFIPTELSIPSAVLKGHNSIVNTGLIHPQFPLILTAGIESTITLHSPFPSCPFSRRLSLTPQEVRQLPSSTTPEEARVIDSLLLGVEPAFGESADEAEMDTIRLFDRILRMEGGADPFEVLPWVQTSEDVDDSSSDASMV
ncbi:WD40 repeat-like protein [Lentinula edodes]|uniref:WD40 repeat-like protein n=1 Tax=Lentinula edodes TaxID=5353 RepID=A0A1Q3E248_LENED|nr:WD40 repeat-like protein [Lentinula edodes]